MYIFVVLHENVFLGLDTFWQCQMVWCARYSSWKIIQTIRRWRTWGRLSHSHEDRVGFI